MLDRIANSFVAPRRRARIALAMTLVLLAVAGSVAPGTAARPDSHPDETQFKRLAAKAAARAASIKATASRMKNYRYGSRTMRMGSKGADVMKLQKYLTALQYPTTPDGVYGAGTKRSVVGFERARGRKVDGVVQRKQAKKIRLAAKKRRTNTTGHVFPVPGAHNYGGASASFGAPRQGHSHQGQDVFAACGSALLAAQGGIVRVKAYQASGAGHYIVVRGASSGEDYVYMHMTGAFPGTVGTVVTTGQQIGTVGASGNASGCHLHFELWGAPGWYAGGAPYDPKPSLLLWDAYS